VLRRLFATADLYSLTVIRIVLGFEFFVHGCQKMLGWFGGAGFYRTMAAFTGSGIPPVFAFLAICAEFFGGIGLLLGFLGRVAAFGILCNMVVAVATRHWQNGMFMNWTGRQKGEGFEYHLLAIAICLAILISGSGALSMDRLISRRAPPT
jgi:putative oxidoreductase